jgi:hypothetical protein
MLDVGQLRPSKIEKEQERRTVDLRDELHLDRTEGVLGCGQQRSAQAERSALPSYLERSRSLKDAHHPGRQCRPRSGRLRMACRSAERQRTEVSREDESGCGPAREHSRRALRACRLTGPRNVPSKW